MAIGTELLLGGTSLLGSLEGSAIVSCTAEGEVAKLLLKSAGGPAAVPCTAWGEEDQPAELKAEGALPWSPEQLGDGLAVGRHEVGFKSVPGT